MTTLELAGLIGDLRRDLQALKFTVAELATRINHLETAQ